MKEMCVLKTADKQTNKNNICSMTFTLRIQVTAYVNNK